MKILMYSDNPKNIHYDCEKSICDMKKQIKLKNIEFDKLFTEKELYVKISENLKNKIESLENENKKIMIDNFYLTEKNKKNSDFPDKKYEIEMTVIENYFNK